MNKKRRRRYGRQNSGLKADGRFELRIPTSKREFLDRAAALSAPSLSDFILTAAEEKAMDVLSKQDDNELTKDQKEAIVRLLQEPRQPNKALIDFMNRDFTVTGKPVDDERIGEYGA